MVFDPAFVAELRADAQRSLAELGQRLGDGELWVTKFTVAGVLECETHFLHPEPFAWTPARARGQVSHRAIQLLLSWRGEPTPADLVDEAMARLADEERGIGDVDRRARCRRPGRPAGSLRRARHPVPRVLPTAQSELAPDDRGVRAVAEGRADRAAGARRPRHREAGRGREPQGADRPEVGPHGRPATATTCASTPSSRRWPARCHRARWPSYSLEAGEPAVERVTRGRPALGAATDPRRRRRG